MTREYSTACWPQGYYAPDGSRGTTLAVLIETAIAPYRGKTALEIGPGGGYWTKNLCNFFDVVHAADVVPQTSIFRSLHSASTKIHYHVVEDDGKLPAIAADSIDFVWSYDTFCHLPFDLSAAYFCSIARVLCPGGRAVIMFPCNERHPGRTNQHNPRNAGDVHGWFDCFPADIQEMAKAAKLSVINMDIFDNNRDRLVLLQKPEACPRVA